MHCLQTGWSSARSSPRDDRYVIVPAAVERKLQQVAAHLFGRPHGPEMLGDLVVAYVLRQAVAADQITAIAIARCRSAPPRASTPRRRSRSRARD